VVHGMDGIFQLCCYSCALPVRQRCVEVRRAHLSGQERVDQPVWLMLLVENNRAVGLEYDYGIINLNCTIGQTVGWLSFGVRSNQLGIPVRIDGYPQADGKPASTMWQSPGKITDESTDIWHYDADTWHGDSGAYVRRSADNVVMGINSHDSNLLNFNAGVRFTLSVYNNLTSWRDDTCC
jgi:V8-like Glu-specific endopeptidase